MEVGVTSMKSNNFQSLLQQFFLERLINQQRASNCTVQSYRDTFRLFLKYLNDEYYIKADMVKMETVNADIIMNFLDYLEIQRSNKCKTVNNRLAAIKSFMDYVSYEAPEYLEIIRKVKAIPLRRIEKKEVCYLTKEEIEGLLNVCNTSTLKGRQDYLMILLLYNTGIRVSEMVSIRKKDVIESSNGQHHLKIMGKGRKERTIPLWKNTSKLLSQYIKEHNILSEDYLLAGRNIEHLTRSGVRYRIDCIVKEARKDLPSLQNKSITPHVFRHSTAMGLLQSGVDISTIAIWLGHETIETTHKYMVADMKLKEEALRNLSEPSQYHENTIYRASEDILSFLISL